ncbi:MAG: hypothetical protein GC152_15745 [Alphaproteobacteria bacterium]|nr:hypothetical protein [Alphaproteobacteria bacterium]
MVSSGQAQENQDETERTANEQQKSTETFSVPVRIIEEPEAADARERGEQEAAEREQKDLLAQQSMDAATRRMSELAVWQTVLIAIGTAALIYTLWLTRQTNKAAWAAVNETRKIGEAQVRAYVAVVDGRYEFREADLIVSATIKNVGQSPANFVRMKCEVTVFNKETSEIIYERSSTGRTGDGSIVEPIPASMQQAGVVRIRDFDQTYVSEIAIDAAALNLCVTVSYDDVFRDRSKPDGRRSERFTIATIREEPLNGIFRIAQ